MIGFIIALSLILLAYFILSKKRSYDLSSHQFPEAWRAILNDKVKFYRDLPSAEKARFEKDISRFLKRVRITGVKTDIDITDKLLVASSAAIPVFGFPDWDYTFLDEVLLYPGSFDRQYTINSREETITGMVGEGVMEGKMILSKPSLHRGFENETDKQNVGVHEFIHLLDKEDGVVDGIPATLADKSFSIPWLKLIREKMEGIRKGANDINSYAATHEREFLAVAGEYFFERPQLLEKNHPDLYMLLAKAFQQDTSKIIGASVSKDQLERNDPCPCGSGKKYKKCCLNK